jgi:hypothetical protein
MSIEHISSFLYLRPLQSQNRLQILGMEVRSYSQFGVSAIWCRTRNCYRLHVACDMVLQYGVAICCADTESHTKSEIH